jgi:hypothetical protein
VVLIVARKNGKTSMLPAYALYELVYGTGRPEILLAADYLVFSDHGLVGSTSVARLHSCARVRASRRRVERESLRSAARTLITVPTKRGSRAKPDVAPKGHSRTDPPHRDACGAARVRDGRVGLLFRLHAKCRGRVLATLPPPVAHGVCRPSNGTSRRRGSNSSRMLEETLGSTLFVREPQHVCKHPPRPQGNVASPVAS